MKYGELQSQWTLHHFLNVLYSSLGMSCLNKLNSHDFDKYAEKYGRKHVV